MRAPGAIPLTRPRGRPKTDAVVGAPAAVDAVCVPWPSALRAEHSPVRLSQNSPGTARRTDM